MGNVITLDKKQHPTRNNFYILIVNYLDCIALKETDHNHLKLKSRSSFQHSRTRNPENETKSGPILKYEQFYYASVHYVHQEIWALDLNYLTKN